MRTVPLIVQYRTVPLTDPAPDPALFVSDLQDTARTKKRGIVVRIQNISRIMRNAGIPLPYYMDGSNRPLSVTGLANI
jgi:hypothetical protein